VILRAVSPSNTLRTRGFFRSNKSRWDLDLSDFVTRFFRSSATTESEMLNALMPVLPRSSLQIDDFEHMRTQLEMAQRLLEHGIATGQRANLLLYGVPGTGKSEFGRLLADQLGTTAVSIGETDDDGEEPDRGDRLLHLTVARKLVEQRHSAILLIDEAEDLFLSDTRSKGSKLWLNKLVEDGAGPHIWIVNDPGLLGEPVIRRMDMAIEFAVPPPAARRRIVEQAFARMANAGSSVAPSMVCQLTNELTGLNTSPAIVSAAIRTAERIGGTENCVAIARALAKASGRRGQDDLRLGHIAFDPGLSSANFDLKTLAGRLAETDMNWSLLLSGPPGTGKSAYAHFLAQKAGIDLISVSGADLLGPFVGQTEERISEVFARAEQGGSLLLIDEADSFLGNRDQAGQNWEVSMTNEMLRQMERGRARFIATTNRADTLDPASARRFALHVAFKPMSVEKSNMMFEETFGIVAPASFSKIVGLTPGDFAQAKNRAALMNETNSQTLVSWLADAVNARDGMRVKVGF
jgi:transitional endoplasmic reticulum ATPase